MSDIEGKVTRVGASERGQRMSFKANADAWELGAASKGRNAETRVKTVTRLKRYKRCGVCAPQAMQGQGAKNLKPNETVKVDKSRSGGAAAFESEGV